MSFEYKEVNTMENTKKEYWLQKTIVKEGISLQEFIDISDKENLKPGQFVFATQWQYKPGSYDKVGGVIYLKVKPKGG